MGRNLELVVWVKLANRNIQEIVKVVELAKNSEEFGKPKQDTQDTNSLLQS